MFTKFFLISIIQLYLFQTSFSVRFGHEVGSTSMDSTHYDRRIFQQQCPLKERYQATYWTNIKSSSANNSNGSHVLLFKKQFIINNEEDRLVTRASSETVNVDNTDPLNIDQAVVHIVVNKQVRVTMSLIVYVKLVVTKIDLFLLEKIRVFD
jgi:hypothetical protein